MPQPWCAGHGSAASWACGAGTPSVTCMLLGQGSQMDGAAFHIHWCSVCFGATVCCLPHLTEAPCPQCLRAQHSIAEKDWDMFWAGWRAKQGILSRAAAVTRGCPVPTVTVVETENTRRETRVLRPCCSGGGYRRSTFQEYTSSKLCLWGRTEGRGRLIPQSTALEDSQGKYACTTWPVGKETAAQCDVVSRE